MTFPSIPDTIYKVLLLAGILLIGYSFFESQKKAGDYNLKVDQSNSNIDSLTIKEMVQSREKKILKDVSSQLAKKYNVPDPILEKDSSLVIFNLTLVGPRQEVTVTDSLRNLWSKYKAGDFAIELLNEKIKMTKANLKISEEEYNQSNYLYIMLAILGIIFMLAGFTGMEKFQTLQERILKLDIEQKEIKYKFCQSCGKKFSSIRPNGKNENGELNPAFCVECFDKGNFIEPDLTFEEFKERCTNIVNSYKKKREKELLMTRFENLERWKRDPYL